MAVVNILVEGKDDIVFLCRLLEVMRAERGLEALDWIIPNKERKVILGKRQRFGDSYVRVGKDVIAITETGGFSKPPSPGWRFVKTGKQEDFRVSQYLIMFDADSQENFLGNVQDYGGYETRKKYVEGLYSNCGVSYKTFLFPNNSNDGAMEDLVRLIIKPDYRFVIDSMWPAFRDEVENECREKQMKYFDYSSKCALSQFASIFNANVAKDLYWVAALWDESIWDWQSQVLRPIKEFLTTNLPMLFR